MNRFPAGARARLFCATSLLMGRLRLKCDGTCAETRFRFSSKRTSPFKSVGRERQFSRLLAAEVCASAVVMLDIPCSEVVRRVLATHSNRQFPLHFPSRASPRAITFQLESTIDHSTVPKPHLKIDGANEEEAPLLTRLNQR